jgi:hypothetical protein
MWSIGFLGDRATVSLLGDRSTESDVMHVDAGESSSGSPGSLEPWLEQAWSILSLGTRAWRDGSVELINWSLPWAGAETAWVSPLDRRPVWLLSLRARGGMGDRMVMSWDMPGDIKASLGDMRDSRPSGDRIIVSLIGEDMPEEVNEIWSALVKTGDMGRLSILSFAWASTTLPGGRDMPVCEGNETSPLCGDRGDSAEWLVEEKDWWAEEVIVATGALVVVLVS